MNTYTAYALALPLACSLPGTDARAADLQPQIRAMGAAERLVTTTASVLDLSLELTAGEQTGNPADWWVLADTPQGWYHLDLAHGWVAGERATTYQGELLDIPPREILHGSGFEPGTYNIYFGVDTDPNGELDQAEAYYDSITVDIREPGSFTIVDTNQIDDFTASHGEDSDFTINPPSYTDNGDGTVTDNVTGLMWQQSADTDGDGSITSDDKMTFSEAQRAADDLTLAGYTDWRLPTIKELYSLIDFSGIDPSGYEGSDTRGLVPFIDTRYFEFAYGDLSVGERIIDAQYASSSLYVANTAGDGGATMFGVNFADGRIKGYGLSLFGRDKTFNVLYVRGNSAYGINDFVSHGDGTITDQATNLMWSRDDSREGMNWEEALDWVGQKNSEAYLGYTDWRLPSVKELQAIVDYGRSPATTGSAAIDPLFNATPIINEANQLDYPGYWSSTTHANWSQNAGLWGAYVAFGRAMGYMNGGWVDVHGAGAQRSDPKAGNPSDYPTGHGPQGDAIRIYNHVRLVRDAGV